jgi:hypothetical protein
MCTRRFRLLNLADVPEENFAYMFRVEMAVDFQGTIRSYILTEVFSGFPHSLHANCDNYSMLYSLGTDAVIK